MKKHWLKRQVDNVDLYDQKIYSDKDIQVFSQANHLTALLKAYETSKEDVRKDKDAYNRVDEDRKPRLGATAGK